MPKHHDPIRRLNQVFVLFHFLSALTASLLLRRLDLSSAAAIFGSLIYTAGPFMGTTQSLNYLFAAVWIPLSALMLLRATDRPRAGLRPTTAKLAAAIALVGLIVPCALALGLAVLGAMGLDAARTSPLPRIPALLALVGAAFFVVAFLLALTQDTDIRKFTPLALSGIGALLLALYLKLKPHPAWAILLLVWELAHHVAP